eukprot:CAMPEP_0206314562 /NCGR_PEP_ID=MMETSP0106_2-20121207/15081_1 /ASSEMBLY_ACC=CAM_ASM_000206 /TAXON_ID=81532 /ORGANISM="Acanthoeca-like sp., Strain 10tr" /LENGTH=98 /DNA_ID=CAMNT_0053745921 /DNA_START=178 /DNA_END=474 /DNA_ORIENTATION=-
MRIIDVLVPPAHAFPLAVVAAPQPVLLCMGYENHPTVAHRCVLSGEDSGNGFARRNGFLHYAVIRRRSHLWPRGDPNENVKVTVRHAVVPHQRGARAL